MNLQFLLLRKRANKLID